MERPPLIDICFNFAHESFRADESEVLARARDAGIIAMICPGSSLEDSELGIALAQQYPGRLYPTVGVHPHHAKLWDDGSAARVKNMAKHSVAIGECGLDFNRNYSPRDAQLRCFEDQLTLACELNLPALLHERDAHADFIAMLKPIRDRLKAAVAHCFTGEKDTLFAYLDLDLYIGITGWICDERRGAHLKDLVKEIPQNRILIETDAPYLLPRSLPAKPKNRRNEPAFLAHVLTEVAEARGEKIEVLAQATTDNARRLFQLTSD